MTEEEKIFFTPNYLSNIISTNTSEQSPFLTEGRENLNPIINKVLEKVLLLNDGNSFVSAMIQDYGYPAWDKAILTTSNDEDGIEVNIVHIPFALTSESELTSYLFAVIDANDEIEYAQIKRSDLDVVVAANDINFDISYHIFIWLHL